MIYDLHFLIVRLL